MRSLLLSTVLALGALGLSLGTPTQAKAAEHHGPALTSDTTQVAWWGRRAYWGRGFYPGYRFYGGYYPYRWYGGWGGYYGGFYGRPWGYGWGYYPYYW